MAMISAEKAERYADECEKYIAENHCPTSDAASIRGKLGHARSFQWGRYGSAALRPFQERQMSGRHGGLNHALRSALRWWTREMREHKPKAMPFNTQGMPLHVTISDGEGSGSVGVSYHKPRDESWRVKCTRWDVPQQIRSL